MPTKPPKKKLPVTTAQDLLTVSLGDLIEAARGGDTLAARQAVEILQMEIRLGAPIPESARNFMCNALAAGLDGKSINSALGLSRKGIKNTWAAADKRLAVDIVRQFVENHLSIEAACQEARDAISGHIKAQPPAWRGFKNRVPSQEQLKGWYFASLGKLVK